MKPYYIVAALSIALPFVVLLTSFLDEPTKTAVAIGLLSLAVLVNGYTLVKRRRSAS